MPKNLRRKCNTEGCCRMIHPTHNRCWICGNAIREELETKVGEFNKSGEELLERHWTVGAIKDGVAKINIWEIIEYWKDDQGKEIKTVKEVVIDKTRQPGYVSPHDRPPSVPYQSEISDICKPIEGGPIGNPELPIHERVGRCASVPLEKEPVNQETCEHEAFIIKKGGEEIGLTACVHCGFKGEAIMSERCIFKQETTYKWRGPDNKWWDVKVKD